MTVPARPAASSIEVKSLVDITTESSRSCWRTRKQIQFEQKGFEGVTDVW